MLGTTDNNKIDFDKETPKYCDFCGKKLEQTKVFIQGKTKFFPKYQDCDCKEFKERLKKEKEIKLEERRKQKLINKTNQTSGKSYFQIFFQNIFTLIAMLIVS